MIATEKAAAIQTANAAAKQAMATSVSAMRVATRIGRVMQTGAVMRIVPAMRTARAAPTGRVMSTGRAVRIAPAAQIDRVAPSLHVGRLDPWAARASATSAHCSVGSTPTATTCLTGASSPNYRNSSTVVGRDHPVAVLPVRESAGAALMAHPVAAAIDLNSGCVSGASKVRRAAIDPVHEIATPAAHAATIGAVPTAPIMHPTGLGRRKPARTRRRPFEAL